MKLELSVSFLISPFYLLKGLIIALHGKMQTSEGIGLEGTQLTNPLSPCSIEISRFDVCYCGKLNVYL